MNANTKLSLLAILMLLAPMAHATKIWTRANTNFTQSDSSLIDVLIPGVVSLTRTGSAWLYNPDGGDGGPDTGTPSDTEWAFGDLADHDSLGYQSFDSLRGLGHLSDVLLPNKPMVVHIISKDIYLSLMFTAWPQGGGFFAYTRSTPPPIPPPTVWTGDSTNFTQSATAQTDVLIPGAVSLTRGGNHWLFNPEGGDGGAGFETPTDTEWAFGDLADHLSLPYQSFFSLRNGDLSGVLLFNKPMVLHLIDENIYLSVMFTAWPHGGGYFAYIRSTPSAVVLPPPSPMTITQAARSDNQISFTFNADAGRTYAVESRSDAVSGTWGTASNYFASLVATNFTFSETISASNKFYRVRTP